jgi:hypothetical protein
MLKLTTNQLFDLCREINAANGGYDQSVIKADTYYADEMGKPGKPCACARDIHGDEHVLVIWYDSWADGSNPGPDEDELMNAAAIDKLLAP